MTTNNEVKAQRLCTLWGQTFDFNDFKFCSLRGGVNRNDTLQRVYVRLKNGDTLYSPYYNEEQAWEVYNQVILAIASAQRPWLKAEGFEFVEGEVYHVLNTYGSHFFAVFRKNTPIESLGCGDYNFSEGFNSSDSKGIYYSCEDSYYMSVGTKKENVVAFKPISDSQEAWDAVAGVEVYKESTNDTQTNG